MPKKNEIFVEPTHESITAFFEKWLKALEFYEIEARCVKSNLCLALENKFEVLILNPVPDDYDASIEVLEYYGIPKNEARAALKEAGKQTGDAQRDLLLEALMCERSFRGYENLKRDLYELRHKYSLLERAQRIWEEKQNDFPTSQAAFENLFNEESKFYAPKLAMLFQAWAAVQSEKAHNTLTPKARIKNWLKKHSAEFGITDLGEELRDRMASIANWEPAGGRRPQKAKKSAQKPQKEAEEEKEA